MAAVSTVNGSAIVNGELWGMRARDWAETMEVNNRPWFEAGLRAAKVGQGTAYLDVGCGSGLAAQIASNLKARVSGLDASAAMIAIAKERVPDGNFRVGEIEDLPYKDGTFDVVTGFNSFQYAIHPVNALKQARRVTRNGGLVLVGIWGKQEDCEAAGHIAALGSKMPAPPPGTPGPFALSEPGRLEALIREAGLTPLEGADINCPWVYEDLDRALRSMLSAGVARRAIRHSGEESVRQAVAKSIAPFKLANGGYRLENKFRYLITKV